MRSLITLDDLADLIFYSILMLFISICDLLTDSILFLLDWKDLGYLKEVKS